MIRDLQLKIDADLATRSRIVESLLRHPGIESASLQAGELSLVYDLRTTDTRTIVGLIGTAGSNVALNLFQRMLLNLRCYRESIISEDANNEIGWESCVREIYVSRYRHRRHGRRDDRPKHWRQYPVQRQ